MYYNFSGLKNSERCVIDSPWQHAHSCDNRIKAESQVLFWQENKIWEVKHLPGLGQSIYKLLA